MFVLVSIIGWLYLISAGIDYCGQKKVKKDVIKTRYDYHNLYRTEKGPLCEIRKENEI